MSSCVSQDAIDAAEEGGVMGIGQDSKHDKVRDEQQFQAIRIWLQSFLIAELPELAKLSVFKGSFNADGAAAIGAADQSHEPAHNAQATGRQRIRHAAALLEDLRRCSVLEAAASTASSQ